MVLLMGVVDSAACRPEGCWFRTRGRMYALRGNVWTALTPDGPCFGKGSVAATPSGVVFFAGAAPTSPWPAESWLWRENVWTKITSMPTSRRAARIAYDPARNRVVLFGGDDAGGMLGDTWEWDGQRWTEITTS